MKIKNTEDKNRDEKFRGTTDAELLIAASKYAKEVLEKAKKEKE